MEIQEYFQNKHPNMLIKDFDLHIARVKDRKTLKKAHVMVKDVLKKRNVITGIHYYIHHYRCKVCSKYGHVEKTFATNQLLYDEHLTAAIFRIDVNKEEFLKKMSIAEVIAHQYQLVLIIVCRCKNSQLSH
jgi:hypothetical protein